MSQTEVENDKLSVFRKMGKYCDADIQVGGKLLPVHKVVVGAASEYFDRMFNENPNERRVVVLLPDDVNDAVGLFEDVVLPFIYTNHDGRMINKKNVVNVLRLSVLFSIQRLEDRCIEFIRQSSNISNVLNVFTSAKSLKRTAWIPILSCYIMKHFHEVCDDELLMKFSFDDLKALLRARFSLSPDNEDKFLNTIIKWCHRCEERGREYFNYLIDCTNFPNISDRYMKCLLKKYCWKTPSVENSPSLSTEYELDDDIECGKQSISELHMYVADDADNIRVYSANKTTDEWNVSSVKKYPSNDRSYSPLASLKLDGHLYSLGYSINENTFNARSNILFSSDVRSLKPPPVRMESFSMCSLPKSIYVSTSECFYWDGSKNFNIVQDVDKWAAFDKKRIIQGIFEYNIVVDKWFPLPTLVGEKFGGSAVTADNNVLYLVDSDIDEPTSPSCYETDVNIRALDVRTSKWKKLTKTASTYEGRAILGCAHEGKIYICPSFGDCKKPGVVIGVYDLKTNRWDKFQKVNYIYEIDQLLFYQNHLWTFGRSVRNLLCEIEVFNPVTQEWSQSPLSNVNHATEDGSRNVHFENAFLFESTLF